MASSIGCLSLFKARRAQTQSAHASPRLSTSQILVSAEADSLSRYDFFTISSSSRCTTQLSVVAEEPDQQEDSPVALAGSKGASSSSESINSRRTMSNVPYLNGRAALFWSQLRYRGNNDSSASDVSTEVLEERLRSSAASRPITASDMTLAKEEEHKTASDEAFSSPESYLKSTSAELVHAL